MAGMRDRLIHDGFGVDYQLVWDGAQQFGVSIALSFAESAIPLLTASR